MNFRRRLAALIIRGRYILLAVILLSAIPAAAAVSRTRINYDMAEYLAEDTMTRKGLRVMEQEFGSARDVDDSAEISGANLKDLQLRIGREIPVALLISVAVVLIMLAVTSHAWLEPLLILAVLAVSIVLNMGTNFIFPSVSFVTYAVCAILQLALSIDYAIMLLHAYNGYLDDGLDAKEAMTEALAECFMRITSSALTTVAGLLSLLFMSFKIGFDIGMVLSKGILISMLGVFLLMPALTLMTGKALRKTRHRPLSVGGSRLAGLVFRIRKPLAGCMILIVLGGLYLNSRVEYTFTENTTLPNPLALMFPNDGEGDDYGRQRELVSRLESLTMADGRPVVRRTLSLVSAYSVDDLVRQAGIPAFLLQWYCGSRGLGDPVPLDRLLDSVGRDLDSPGPLSWTAPDLTGLGEKTAEVRSRFIGPRYDRVVVYLTLTPADRDFNRYMDDVLDTVREVCGDDICATGVPMSTYDISHAFRSDLLKVNLITLTAIFLIVALSFRSLRMPLILVFVIEGAIWITIGISALAGQPVFFVSYLICLSIQMGATIDYGILLSDQYRSCRAGGLPPQSAMAAALKKALPTILTSGVILIVAGFAVGKVCTIYYIYSIGLLVSRGALVSALLMLTLLPSLLLLGDRFIIRQGKTIPDEGEKIYE